VAEEKVQGVFIEYDMHFLTFQIIIFVGQMHWLQFKININANWSFQLFDGMIICFIPIWYSLGSESCFTNGHLCALTTTGEHDKQALSFLQGASSLFFVLCHLYICKLIHATSNAETLNVLFYTTTVPASPFLLFR
jgi:hypothetical protein